MLFKTSQFLLFLYFFASVSGDDSTTSTVTTPTVSGRNVTQYFKSRDPFYFLNVSREEDTEASQRLRELMENEGKGLVQLSTSAPESSSERNPTSDSRRDPEINKSESPFGTLESYPPSSLPAVDNNVFKEFARLSKLTEYMLIDPKFAEDYAKDRLTNTSKILYIVYGDVVKHIFASESLTQRKPPRRRNRIRYRMKSLNDKPPQSCSESGRETHRIFCPFSYGYQWWDCLMPDEVCDGVPHCGMGDDEDPKMCLYFRAAISKLERTHQSLMTDIAQSHKIAGKNSEPSRMAMYNPEEA